MPKSTSARSLTSWSTLALTARWYIGCPPIWYGHQIAGRASCSCGTSLGFTLTCSVEFAGTATVVLNRIRLRGPSIEPANSVACAVAVLVRRSAFTVRSELLRSGALFCTTCAPRTETGPSRRSCGANCRPVQLSGERGFQSTMSSVRYPVLLLESLRNTSSAIALAPSRTCAVMSYSNREYAPCNWDSSATLVSLTHRFARDRTPLRTRKVCSPGRGCRRSCSRYHQFTANWPASTAARLLEKKMSG